ncbi:MAG: ComEC/Rec2 family competence protein [Anaerolineae bacterium]|nr:ComEC/Rec2 family competence protein [Anaerolineae bacterium]
MTLIYLASAWLAGIALDHALSLPWQVLPLLALLGLVGLIGWRGGRRCNLLCACLVMLALGAGRRRLAQPRLDAHALARYNDLGPVTLEGVVVREPDVREEKIYLRLRAEQLRLADGREVTVDGLALVQVDRYPTFAYGDRLRVRGPLETPPTDDDFSYRDYLARQGIHSIVPRCRATRLGSGEGSPFTAALLALKGRAQATIAAILHEPEASLLTGILLGIESGIPADLADAFSATGTTHIIAISGFNITIISGIFAGLARRMVGGKRAVWVAIGGVVLYTLFVGASAAVVRAAMMGVIYLLGKHLGRESFAPTSLAAAAVLMTAINPFTLWDVGFQLSFAATVGLVLYTGPLERGAVALLSRLTSPERAERAVGWFSEALLVTLAAQISTTPLLVAYFRRLSLVTLLTNFLILPVQPAVMVGGGLATIAGLVWLPLGKALGWAAWLALAYTIEVVRLTARVPYAWVDLGRVEPWMAWAAYGLLAAVTWWGYQPAERRAMLRGRACVLWLALTARLSDRLVLGLSGVLLLLAAIAWRTLPDGELHVAFLDVGQGDAIFVQTPSGRQVLIDGGPSPSLLLSHLGRRMPFWDHSLDLVVLTHPDDDVLAGLLPVLERYQVAAIVEREADCYTPLCDRWRELVGSSTAEVYRGEAGLQLWLDEGVLLTVLHPGPAPFSSRNNDNSLVLRLDHGAVCFLLAGDAGEDVEAALVAGGAWLDCTVLKAAHHGDGAATTAPFLAAVTPDAVVIPVGAGNLFHHPHWEMLERLGSIPVYRTDQDGTVEVSSDGRSRRVETAR